MTISGGSISGPKAIEQAAKQSENTKESIETIKLSVTGGSFTGEIESKNLKKFVSDGGFSTDLRNTGYLADSAAAEIKRAGDTTYVYYTTTEDAMAAAQPGDTVTFLNVSPEQPVTLTLQFNDGITLPTPRVYLKTPNAPGQRAFLRCAASFFLEIRQYSCEKMSCAVRKFLAAGHIESWKNTP